MSRPIILCVRTKEGQHRVDCLTSDSTVADLKGVLLSLSGGSIGRVLSGYPPQALTLNEESLTLEEAHVRSGETLIIVESNQPTGMAVSGGPYPYSSATSAKTTPAAATAAAAAGLRPPSPSLALPATDELNNIAPAPLSAASATNRLAFEGVVNASNDRSATSLLANMAGANVARGGESVSRRGVLLRRAVPADNSCLFTSIYFALSGGELNLRAGANFRQIIANAVAADAITYNEAFLARPNLEYCTWILNEEHWGGAIELAILSKHFKIEMVAVDTQNERLNRFGEDENYETRILLIYDGVHYDPLLLEYSDGSGICTIFSTDDHAILALALEVAHEAKRSGQFTDVQNFTLRCVVCNRLVVGELGAQAHAKDTGHSNFGEVYPS